MKYLFALIIAMLSLSVVANQKRPNIIVFLVDDMGVMDTSVPFITDKNGEPKREKLNDMYHTPSMERIAASGCRFSQCYAMSVCSPSRVSLMTGQNSARHGVTNWINPFKNNGGKFAQKWNWQGLDENSITLPRLLKNSGYKTIHIGKAHFAPKGFDGENPQKLGFDINIGGCAWGQPGSYLGVENFAGRNGQNSVPNLSKYHGKEIFLTDALTFEAMEQIDKCAENETPFFLYMSHYAVHSPFTPDKRFVGKYQKYLKSTTKEWVSFASMIESMDKSLGDILDFLNKKGIAEDTLIIFLGDNGTDARVLPVTEVANPNSVKVANAAPLRGMKATKYEGGMRVPFIVSWAKVNPENENQKSLPIESGAFRTGLTAIYDIAPTLLAFTKTAAPRAIFDGVDVSARLKSNEANLAAKAENREFLMHFPHEHRNSYFTVYTKGDWKLIKNFQDNSYELYNLAEDISESNNLAQTNPYMLKNMAEAMSAMLKRQGAMLPKFD